MMDEFRINRWEDFVGQERMKERLRIHITAARKSSRQLDPILLVGKTGFGKTTLATIIADEMKQDLVIAGMPITDRALMRLVDDHTRGTVVLFDEIHRARPALQESLLPLLEFGYVQNSSGIRRHAANMSFVLATTEADKLIKPLWDRCPIRPEFDDYTNEEMGTVVMAMARTAGVKLTKDACEALGRATGGTPRRAASFVLAARDLTIEHKGKTPPADVILEFCRVDESGVTQAHRDYLNALEALGGIAGLNTLRNYLHLGESVVTELEPMLLDQKLIRLTSSGRELTRQGQLKIEGQAA